MPGSSRPCSPHDSRPCSRSSRPCSRCSRPGSQPCGHGKRGRPAAKAAAAAAPGPNSLNASMPNLPIGSAVQLPRLVGKRPPELVQLESNSQSEASNSRVNSAIRPSRAALGSSSTRRTVRSRESLSPRSLLSQEGDSVVGEKRLTLGTNLAMLARGERLPGLRAMDKAEARRHGRACLQFLPKLVANTAEHVVGAPNGLGKLGTDQVVAYLKAKFVLAPVIVGTQNGRWGQQVVLTTQFPTLSRARAVASKLSDDLSIPTQLQVCLIWTFLFPKADEAISSKEVKGARYVSPLLVRRRAHLSTEQLKAQWWEPSQDPENPADPYEELSREGLHPTTRSLLFR
mmetsp:Transcript_162029/g.299022  ORF Transcript_162029/g.299022 Transcript_162029/m.299022 type:complete len:343 (-) Transcript_162029:78-1106(-)